MGGLVKTVNKNVSHDGKTFVGNSMDQVHVKVEDNDRTSNVDSSNQINTEIENKDIINENENENENDNDNENENGNDNTQNAAKRRKSNSGGSGLTIEQKKENHIMSENRRRAQIRSTFDKLVEIVPQLQESESRSELAVLTKTSNYIEHLRSEYERLQIIRKERGLPE